MPKPAMIQAISAPKPPVWLPNRRGSMKMPDPIIDPTTMAVSAGSDIFWVCDADSTGGDSAEGGADWVDMGPHLGTEAFVIPGLPIRTALPIGSMPCGRHREKHQRRWLRPAPSRFLTATPEPPR